MTQHAKGEFQVQVLPQTQDESAGVSVARFSIDKVITGDLEATTKGEMLAAGAPTGAGVYVAIERVSGTLNGKKGSFVLVHHGTMNKDGQDLKINVAQDSGTGELAGLAGTFVLTIEDSKHYYDLEYTLEG